MSITNILNIEDKSKVFFDFYLLSFIYTLFTNKHTTTHFYKYDDLTIDLHTKVEEFLNNFIEYLIIIFNKLNFTINAIDDQTRKKFAFLTYLHQAKNSHIPDKIIKIDMVLSLYHSYNNLIMFSDKVEIPSKYENMSNSFLSTDICKFLKNFQYDDNGCYWLYALFTCKNKIKNPWDIYQYSYNKKFISKFLYYIGFGTYENYINYKGDDNNITSIPNLCLSMLQCYQMNINFDILSLISSNHEDYLLLNYMVKYIEIYGIDEKIKSLTKKYK
jgi:hypothetical protein